MMKISSKNAGFGLLELIVAMGLFMIVVVSGSGGVLKSYSVNRLSDEEVNAGLFANEGIDAARSISNQNWNDLSAGSYGIDESSGSWVFSGTSDITGPFTRQVIIENVYRDGSGIIVETGGVLDPDTFKVTSVVNWDFTPTRKNNVALDTYLTNFKKTISIAGDADSLAVNISAATIGGGGNKELQGITLENTGDTDITIDKITVSWVTETGNLVEEIKIDNTSFWKHNVSGTPNGRQPSGTLLDIDDFVFSPSAGAVDIDKIKFDGNMSAETEITLLFELSDGSTKEVIISFVPVGCGLQEDYFTIDTSGANIGGGGNKELKGIVASNTSGDPGCDVIIDKVTVTWTNSKQIQEVKLDGTKIWVHNGAGTPSGKQSSGVQLDVDNFTINSAVGSVGFDKFKFDGNMSGNTFGITILLGDGSTEVVGIFAP